MHITKIKNYITGLFAGTKAIIQDDYDQYMRDLNEAMYLSCHKNNTYYISSWQWLQTDKKYIIDKTRPIGQTRDLQFSEVTPINEYFTIQCKQRPEKYIIIITKTEPELSAYAKALINDLDNPFIKWWRYETFDMQPGLKSDGYQVVPNFHGEKLVDFTINGMNMEFNRHDLGKVNAAYNIHFARIKENEKNNQELTKKLTLNKLFPSALRETTNKQTYSPGSKVELLKSIKELVGEKYKLTLSQYYKTDWDRNDNDKDWLVDLQELQDRIDTLLEQYKKEIEKE